MLRVAREAGVLAKLGTNRYVDIPDQNTLNDIGVTAKQSAAWGKLADLSEDEFSACAEKVAESKARMPTAAVIRMANTTPRTGATGAGAASCSQHSPYWDQRHSWRILSWL